MRDIFWRFSARLLTNVSIRVHDAFNVIRRRLNAVMSLERIAGMADVDPPDGLRSTGMIYLDILRDKYYYNLQFTLDWHSDKQTAQPLPAQRLRHAADQNSPEKILSPYSQQTPRSRSLQNEEFGSKDQIMYRCLVDDPLFIQNFVEKV